MEFNPNKTPVEIETFIQVLIENSTKIHGKNLMI